MADDSIFSRVETALEGEHDNLQQELAVVRQALDDLLKSGDPKEKASARRARLAIDRTQALFDDLFALREKMRGEAATPAE